MVTLTPVALPPLTQDIAWFDVDGPSVAGAARRAAMALAERVGFAPARVAEIGVAFTEVATNLHRHAEHGRLLLRVLRWSAGAGRLAGGAGSPAGVDLAGLDLVGVEFVAIDSGPGMADVTAALRDGVSTAGTLGVGLGAITRFADSFEVHSTPGHGTVMVGCFLPRAAPGGPAPGPARVAGLTRPITGESACGDAFAVVLTADTVGLLLCDGLGHGELAARASIEAVRLFREAAVERSDPAALLRRIHQGISHTRGAAVGVAVLEPAAGVLRFAGLGNISGVILGGARRSALISRPGIAGHQARGFQETRHELAPDALVVLHSDGVSPRWDLAAHPGVTSYGPLVIAATVLRDAGLRRDDASVVVAVPPWR